MNFKTTIILAIALVALGGLYFVGLQVNPTEKSTSADTETITPGTSKISQPIFTGTIGDVVKVTCKAKDKEEWVFEKQEGDGSTAQGDWSITAPIQAKAIPWEVQRFGTQLTNLKYEIRHEPGGAVSDEKAGLAPPQAVITIADADGQEATFEIGLEASSTDTFVRLANDSTIYVGQGVVGTLVKPSILDYRDQQLWSFKNDDATAVEITDHRADPPVTYTLQNQDGTWVFTKPVSARATGKVAEMLRTLGVLRVQKWVDDREDRLSLYGLNPPQYTIRVTTETAPEDAAPSTDDGEADAGDATPKSPTITTYTLRVSDQSPLGEDTKVYVAPGEGTTTGVIMKTLADRLAPSMSEWRDMDLSPVNVTTATRVEISTPAGAETLTKLEQDWKYESDGELGESAAVRELLMAVNDLKAISYMDATKDDDARFGFDKPQATVTMTVPGKEESERITVGGFTDANSKRLVYVRRNAANAVAKVRVADIAALLRDPRSYRDLTILDATRDSIESIAMNVPAACRDGRYDFTLARTGGRWQLVKPVQAPINDAEFNPLLDLLTRLKAASIVGEANELSAYGLHEPVARLSIQYLPPRQTKLEPDTEDPEKLVPVETQPPATTVDLAFSAQSGKVFAHRSDRQVIYAVQPELLNRILSELRSSKVFQFQKETVSAFSIASGGVTHRFRKSDDQWIYETEPDLPLDAGKVDNLLLQFTDLVTPRFVQYQNAAPVSTFLQSPQSKAVIETSETTYEVTVFTQACGSGSARGQFATATGIEGVFLLTPDSIQRMTVNLGDLEP
ncbi:MAG: DUF4340 domain-containing protein [Phycisphaerae bacterium]